MSQTANAGQPERGTLSAAGDAFYDGTGWGWQSLWLNRDEIVDVCRATFGLDVGSVTFLGDGMLNQSWRIGCPDHDRVLRVGRSERTVEQVAYEHAAARCWAATPSAGAGDGTIPVVVAEHDTVPVVGDHTMTLFPFCSGEPGSTVPATVRARVLAPLLADLHRSSLTLDLPQRPGFASVDDRPRWWDWDQVRLAVLDRFGTGPEVRSLVDLVDRATAELDDLLDRWQRTGRLDRRATVHGDLNPRNQLYSGQELVGLIDTDDCRVEPLVWDLANLAYSDPSVSPSSVWRDYLEAGGPLDPRDDELLVPFARIGALTAIMWMTGDDGSATHLALGHLTEIADQLDGSPRRDG